MRIALIVGINIFCFFVFIGGLMPEPDSEPRPYPKFLVSAMVLHPTSIVAANLWRKQFDKRKKIVALVSIILGASVWGIVAYALYVVLTGFPYWA